MDAAEEYSHNVYTKILAALEVRASRENFSMATIEAEYEALCVYQGHGMDGHNFFKEAEIQGQIDAYQVFLYRQNMDNNQ